MRARVRYRGRPLEAPGVALSVMWLSECSSGKGLRARNILERHGSASQTDEEKAKLLVERRAKG
jgi:hypothetical protein